MKAFDCTNISVVEDMTHEFKSSLFFKAGSSMVSDEQMDVITKTLASMMNKDGGILYVGVNDRGAAVNSVTDEYQYLNSIPPYPNNYYGANQDGYKRFILDWVSKNLGNFAATLLSFDFEKVGDVVICKINVARSRVPVWFDNKLLFVRADASTRLLRGADITSFILNIDKEDFIKASQNEKDAFQKRMAEIKSIERPSNHIMVVYPNGEYIHEKSDVDTMLEVIHRAGTEDVMKLGLTGRAGKGNTPYVPFIGKDVYLDNQANLSKTQRELDGYLVFVKTGTGDKIATLTEISNALGLNLHIERY